MTRAKFTITVPTRYLDTGRVGALIDDAVRISGGSTTTPGAGSWVEPVCQQIVAERVAEVSYLATESNYSAVEAAVKDIARAMLDAGEQAVLVQHWVNGSFGFNLYTKENLQ